MLAAAKKRLDDSKGQKLTWLYCRGWNEEHFDKPRYPHKDELDALSTENPHHYGACLWACGCVQQLWSGASEKNPRSFRRLRRRLIWIPDF